MFDSVRARLTAWYTAIVALVLITFSSVSYVLLDRAIRSATDASVADNAREFADAFRHQPSGVTPMTLGFRYSDRSIMVFGSSGQLLLASQSKLLPDERQRIAAAVGNHLHGFTTIAGGREGDGIRIFTVPIEVAGQRYTVVATRDLDEQADRLEAIAHGMLVGIPVALIVAAVGGYIMARKSLDPVTAMSLKARQIGAETLTERITVINKRDELGLLANTLNELLERLQRTFDSQRRFMADASHELRTPLSIIQGEADVALSRADRSADEYRESLGVIQTAVRKVSRIVESLFLLARSDAGRYPVTPSRFYLDELLNDCVRAMRTVAAAQRVTITCHTPSELLVASDESLVHRMVLNLLDNAVKFTPPDENVRVEVTSAGDYYVIRISDRGPGVAPEERDRIFERFYRGAGNPRGFGSSTVSTGAGLGLPIARWIAEAHGGQLSLERSDSSGSTFVVILPRGDIGGAEVRRLDEIASSRV